MNPVVAAMTAGVLVLAGKWARDQPPNINNAIGVAGIAIGLALLENINKDFSRAFGVLIVLSLAIIHVPTITKSAGLSK